MFLAEEGTASAKILALASGDENMHANTIIETFANAFGRHGTGRG